MQDNQIVYLKLNLPLHLWFLETVYTVPYFVGFVRFRPGKHPKNCRARTTNFDVKIIKLFKSKISTFHNITRRVLLNSYTTKLKIKLF